MATSAPARRLGPLGVSLTSLMALVAVGIVPVHGRAAIADSTRAVHSVPAARTGFALSYHPLDASDAELNRTFDTVKQTGVRWVRFDFAWGVVEPKRGHFEWAKLDRAVFAARSRGLAVLATLAYTPGWARRGNTDKFPPTDPADFAAFARKAALRYRSADVRTWEIWNEPNNAMFWRPRPDPRAYTALLEAVYTAIHGVDRHATVLLGGLSPAGPTLDWTSEDGELMSPFYFLRAVYERGGAGAFDAVAFHPYAAQPLTPASDEGANPFQQTSDLHRLMVKNGDKGKKIWGTEAGAWTGGDRAITERAQVRFVREYLTDWNKWRFVGPFLYYELRDRGNNRREREQSFGLLHHDWKPKPAFSTFVETLSRNQ